MATHQILGELKNRPATVKDLAARLELPAPHVLRYVLALQRRGFVALDGIEGPSPVYRLVPEQAAASAAA
ncbi:MAG TPA: helix-turn-helix domain-containing protein [Syntrophobacter fumaroxidans]|nr:helix-turn-helix domain-containing protein [Syntrophobacter fumaroxidans]